jgi:hypothetical protein
MLPSSDCVNFGEGRFQGLEGGGREEVVRDGNGKLLGDERLGVILGHVDALAGRSAEKRLGEVSSLLSRLAKVLS